jgi:hypothetical protein
MSSMDRFDDVSVVHSIDESPPAPRVPRGVRRAFTVVVASVVVSGALAGAAVGLASEKREPAKPATAANEAWQAAGGHPCHHGMGQHSGAADGGGAAAASSGLMRSIGKMIVEEFSPPISDSVCR